MCLTCANPFGREDKYVLLPEQISPADRFKWVKEKMTDKEVSDQELRDFIRKLLPESPQGMKSAIRDFRFVTPENDEEKLVLQKIQEVCALF